VSRTASSERRYFESEKVSSQWEKIDENWQKLKLISNLKFYSEKGY
jgi:hypothetical protein